MTKFIVTTDITGTIDRSHTVSMKVVAGGTEVEVFVNDELFMLISSKGIRRYIMDERETEYPFPLDSNTRVRDVTK